MVRYLSCAYLVAILAPPTSAQSATSSSRHILPLLGLRVGPPIRAAFYAGVALVHQPRPDQPDRGSSGPAIVFEAGSAGGQVSLGHSMGSGFGAARYQLTLLRTWGDPQWVARDQTYLGGEIRVMPLFIGVGLGLFGRVRGTVRGDGHLAVVTLVAGF